MTSGKALCIAAMGVIASGCGNSLNCEIYGDNVKGRIYFTSDVSVKRGKNIHIQYSEDDFSTVKNTEIVWNAQGLLAVPYSVCADADEDFSVRAFQDNNDDGTYTTGEGSGRHDDTSNGNATYKTHKLESPDENAAESDNVWPVVEGVDVFMDGTAGQ